MVLDNNNLLINKVTDPSKLAFIHIPKTGGTFIEALFLNQYNVKFGTKLSPNYYINETIKKSLRRNKRHKLRCSSQHVPINSILLYTKTNNIKLSSISPYYFETLNNKNISFFAIVRNPYQRYLSEYIYTVSGSLYALTQQIEFTIKHCEYLKNDTFCNKLYLDKTWDMHSIWNRYDFCDIDLFNKLTFIRLYHIINNVTERSLEDCHYLTQSEYIFDKRNKTKQFTKYILKTESLTHDIIHLLRDNDIDEEIIERYRKIGKYPKNCTNLTSNDLNQHNRNLIQQLYMEDFFNFNYSIDL